MDFQVVRILKEQKESELGVGSYGAVYKARCDEISFCAAKILHRTFFQSNDPSAAAMLRRFRQECDFLKSINHPNIVRFLGVYDDPDSKLPVLLMELLDESLTKFLARSQTSLPLCTQVNFSHDIALAVSYLHSKRITHRDLSSNNVLLIGGSRAKVTDFGMSKLLDTTARREGLTVCPGTEVYMPPEALREPPEYTHKLDCFSLGPVMIQIITRMFPSPGPRTIQVDDPSSPTLKADRPVLETVRRESHLKLINGAHPLLNIIHRCLSYHQNERPTADELCRQIADIRETDEYVASQEDRDTSSVQECKHDNIEEMNWVNGEKVPCKVCVAPGSVTVDGYNVYIQPYNSTEIYLLEVKRNRWKQLQDCKKMCAALVVVNGLLTAIGGYLDKDEFDTLTSLKNDGEPRWTEELPRMPTKRYSASAIRSNNLVLVTGGLGDDCPLTKLKVEILDLASDPKLWFVASSLPSPLCRHSTAVCGNQVYMLSGIARTTSVVSCDLNTLLLHSVPASQYGAAIPKDQEAPTPWHSSSTLPVYHSVVASFKGKLIAIGGIDPTDQKSTQNVHRYNVDSDTWTVCSEMPSALSLCLASVVQDSEIVVIGGKSNFSFTNSVVIASF